MYNNFNTYDNLIYQKTSKIKNIILTELEDINIVCSFNTQKDFYSSFNTPIAPTTLPYALFNCSVLYNKIQKYFVYIPKSISKLKKSNKFSHRSRRRCCYHQSGGNYKFDVNATYPTKYQKSLYHLLT